MSNPINPGDILTSDELSEYRTLKNDIEINKVRLPFKITRYNELRLKFDKHQKIIEENIKEVNKSKALQKELILSLFKSPVRLKSPPNNPNTYYILDYQPIYLTHVKTTGELIKELNPLGKDSHSILIRELKEIRPTAIVCVTELLKSCINNLDNITICVIPRSNKDLLDSGIRRVACELLRNGGVDGLNCIKRINSVAEQSTHQRLTTPEIKVSLEIQNTDMIKGRNVLVLDDVRTRGCSFEAVNQLLVNAGANFVINLAVAQTVHH